MSMAAKALLDISRPVAMTPVVNHPLRLFRIIVFVLSSDIPN
jgi:hypothetical protein